MDKPISVGDLVAVVRGCKSCGICRSRGMFFTVGSIERSATGQCYECKEISTEDDAITNTGLRLPLYRLKRIPPLDELEGERTEENLKVPA